MTVDLTSLSDLASLPFDEIIDVRSPAEFAEDHLPGAINLPVLDNDERARVGTIYVQEDRFKARRIGGALVSRNAARHLERALADKPGSWRPLVYCWRGGQRSGSFTVILKQVGWRAQTLIGGYKTYRKLVVRLLYETPIAPEVILIDGGTGTAKTRLLHHLADQGAQILDLEGMAEHRGSVFGPTSEHQPSQKLFESRLAQALVQIDPARPVYVEAESSKIGELIVPPSLWKAMISARFVRISAPLGARVSHLVDCYDDLIRTPEKLDQILSKLIPYHGHEQVDAWREMAARGDYATLTAELIVRHYDPRYASVSRRAREEAGELNLSDLSDDALARAAARILKS